MKNQSNLQSMQFGPFKVEPSDRIRGYKGQTMNKQDTHGNGLTFEISDNKDTFIKLICVEWSTGEKDVRVVEMRTDCKDLRRLERGGLRLGIYTQEPATSYIELRQARIKSTPHERWSNLFLADILQLNTGAGIDVKNMLMNLGAIAVGKRAKFLNDTGPRKNYICALFPKEHTSVPIAAFVLTRILPLYNQVMVTDF